MPSKYINVDGKQCQLIAEFSNAKAALSYANDNDTTKGLTVVEKDGKFFLVTMRDAERLASAGYQWTDQMSDASAPDPVPGLRSRNPAYFG